MTGMPLGTSPAHHSVPSPEAQSPIWPDQPDGGTRHVTGTARGVAAP
jgi:hypothetical protein